MRKGLLCIVALCILLPLGLASLLGSPLFFAEQVYRTLDQLDQALESGEISSEDYDILLEGLVGFPFGDAEPDPDIDLAGQDTSDVITGSTFHPRFRYHGSFVQNLDTDHKYVRYDRMAFQSGKFDLDLSLEQRDQGVVLIRARSLKYEYPHGEVIVGSYNLKIGTGLTQGNGNYTSELRRRDNFSSSLSRPIMNRNNGLLLKQRFASSEATLFLSRLEGDQCYKSVYGTAMALDVSKQQFGVVVMRQELGAFGGGLIRTEYVAPFFRLIRGGVSLEGESSFGLGASSAHLYQLETRRGKLRNEVTFFSYGRDYHNLQSGGYAYSDYEETRIDDIDLSYSDKRSGRVGVSVSSAVTPRRDLDIAGAFIRWQNEVTNRSCAAARLLVSKNNLTSRVTSVRFRAIWENRDLEHNSESRKLLSLSARSKLSKRFSLETFQKIERRLRSGTLHYPFRNRFDVQWVLNAYLTATATLNYYAPDIMTGSGRYLNIGAGQKITRARLFAVWIKAQTRYLFSERKLSDWELRVYCDLAA